MNSAKFHRFNNYANLDNYYHFPNLDNRTDFISEAIDNFKDKIDDKYQEYRNQYYTIAGVEFINYSIGIMEYRSRTEQFIDYLNQEYISDLERLSNKQLSYRSFFEKYGTHLIGEAHFGLRYYALYTVLSNDEKDLSKDEFSEVSV